MLHMRKLRCREVKQFGHTANKLQSWEAKLSLAPEVMLLSTIRDCLPLRNATFLFSLLFMESKSDAFPQS